ncbi:Arylsulfatase [Achromobacter insolitus]|uniref:arylsulfatase n=1 Tax=Achromobacter insolitus TaxID=217204 RepID=UPI000972672F|nr:arylsulfatase [Achromobacter insolitus]APX74474.1 arylsulfatase [Achromobacter insolitus]OWT60908.1 arylsulfatase [Achromobacter insolitus]CAB3686925.1 N-acetylgalactosamine-6-O-sulfatase [Achromobacter insolitus]VEG68444.1 Arylsulfatase [Achromobacter insolitus]
MNARKLLSAALFAAAGLAVLGGAQAQTQAQTQAPPANQGQETPNGKKPNILVIFGDDIGQANISAYTHGVVGYTTPNIDRIAKEGTLFTDYYAENSCTAGRSSFITGQSPLRTGLSKVGMPGATVGLQKGDITIAEALKAQGYTTAQFGKNHLGDRDEYLPTRHGFDEFFGNLYHLNAEEEPERPYWPKDPNDPYVKNFSPRGVIKATADGKVQDTGALTTKRMETIDDETVGAAIDYIDKHGKGDKPFFVWMNTTRMHIYTHIRPEHKGKSGMPGNDYADGMWEHDQDVGKLLKKLDDMGIADNTIVIYTTDNGPNAFTWPDAATTPFRSEKDSNWEGAFRVPAMVRWPGKIPAGEIKRGMMSGMDWFPTLLAATGDTNVKERLLDGWAPQAGGTKFKVHLDGYNQLPYLTGKQEKSARDDFYYFNDDGLLVGVRWGDWKAVFCEQRAPGNLNIWQNPFVCLRLPKIYNLRMDPYERADITSDQYNDWLAKNAYLTAIATMKASAFLETFLKYPPSQRPASFSVDQVQERVNKAMEEHFDQLDKQKSK